MPRPDMDDMGRIFEQLGVAPIEDDKPQVRIEHRHALAHMGQDGIEERQGEGVARAGIGGLRCLAARSLGNSLIGGVSRALQRSRPAAFLYVGCEQSLANQP
jgi:hypothetical protein